MTAQATAKPSVTPHVQVQAGGPSTSNDDHHDQHQHERRTILTHPPKLRLQIHDLRHPASVSFLRLIPDVAATLETALDQIITHLYTAPPPPRRTRTQKGSNDHDIRLLPIFEPSLPPTRSVTVILHDFPGVAYTTGTDLDNDHKEIHFSLSYIQTVCRNSNSNSNSNAAADDPLRELKGVLTHELVHCYQHTAPPPSPPPTRSQIQKLKPTTTTIAPSAGTIPQPPSGLIEGIADFVRLQAGLDPPHWKQPASSKERSAKWDQGYEHTAFFLKWLEDVRVGKGAVGMVNDRLFRVGYVGEGEGEDDGDEQEEHGNTTLSSRERFWKGLFGVGVEKLWEEYGRYLDEKIEKHTQLVPR